jgi:DNA repair exonuclease SbcCD ATPase subunit
MVSGRETLANIDAAVTEARRKIAALDDQIEEVNRRLSELRKLQTEDFKDLARVRIGLLSDPELVLRLDEAEHQVLALLAQRDAALKELESQIQAAESGEQGLAQERQAQAARVDSAAEAVDAAEAKTKARLDADPAYRAQRETAHEAERVAMHADEKATRSEEEREQKGAAYRADPLFMYLWNRQYGLPGYKAWGLTRMLDNWVARLIGFSDARANYSRLNEIPQRLREHATGVKATAEEAFAALKALDEEARAADGIPALESVVAAEQERLDAIDARIAAAESDHQGLVVKKALFGSGDDQYSRQAVEHLARELARDDLMELRREARETPLPDDDLIVGRMLERADERHRIEASVQAIKQTADQQHQRLTELEALRADFKRNRYDRAGSTFGDDKMIAMMLAQFLNGMLDRQNLWRVIREQQRYRPQHSDPSFGSGGFGRGTVWGGGLGDLRDLGDIVGGFGRGGRGRGGIGGGFRGGGGGGGFRTGGGF